LPILFLKFQPYQSKARLKQSKSKAGQQKTNHKSLIINHRIWLGILFQWGFDEFWKFSQLDSGLKELRINCSLAGNVFLTRSGVGIDRKNVFVDEV
jgi:hypothetical protein